MKQSILKRIEELGGDISQVKNNSLLENIQAISFEKVLQFKPTDAGDEPFAEFYDEFFEENEELAKTDRNAFIEKAIETYYPLADDDDTTVGQAFWKNDNLFTPLTQGTADYNEWNGDFDDMDFSQCLAVTGGEKPEFILFVFSYGYPDNYFICSNDKNPENPTVFSTDHEAFLMEIEVEGTLKEFLNDFMTKEESKKYIEAFLDAEHD